MKLLDLITNPNDLKNLNIELLDPLCKEIREFLISNVLLTGGHLASNLGVVELVVAMHRVFDTPKDKIIFDVGHQSYVHKILTGRLNSFSTLRQLNGLSGFPKTSESEYDSFNTGHSSTSISAALGMARARNIKNDDYNVVAFIGDGALGSGMAFEALNDAGESNTKLIIIINDNEMSIDKNVGGLSSHLSKLRIAPKYRKTKNRIMDFLKKCDKPGELIIKAIRAIKDRIKLATMSGVVFEELGFTYLGIIDGHNIPDLIDVFEQAKNINGPVVIHTLTKKGLGYLAAEKNPDKFHGVNRYTTTIKNDSIDYSSAFGTLIVNEAKNNPNIVAITAAMTSACGLSEFSEKFPDRFFDVGIAEQHAVTMAAGLAINGIVPVVCIYSTFLQRAYDQILHDVCMQNLHVVFAIDRAGVVGEDGETHQGVFDISYLSHIPNITILSPCCYDEFKQMFRYAINECNGPVAIRYPKGAVNFDDLSEKFEVSKAVSKTHGSDVTIVAFGKMLSTAMTVYDNLKDNNISAQIMNIRTIKPIDKNAIINSASHTKLLVTIEDNVLAGGMGEYIKSQVSLPNDVKVINIGFGDEFLPHGKIDEIHKIYGLDADSITNRILKECAK